MTIIYEYCRLCHCRLSQPSVLSYRSHVYKSLGPSIADHALYYAATPGRVRADTRGIIESASFTIKHGMSEVPKDVLLFPGNAGKLANIRRPFVERKTAPRELSHR